MRIVPSQPEFKYWAFISYSHADRKWGDWLFRALEGYHVPRRIVGRASRDGAIPRRLFPIFRDRDELPTSADLGNNIAESLAQSRYLVVICSPRSAASHWVNEEVKRFKALGRESRLLCLLVDGEPNATDKPGREHEECFPEAVRFRVGPDLSLLRSEPVEPIAADVRREGDGPEKAKVKLIAGLLGVNFDELWQREKRRRVWRRTRSALLGMMIAALAFGAWQWSRHVRIERDIEEGRQCFLRGEPDRALIWLSAAYSQGDVRDPALLFLLHQARLGLPSTTPDRHTGRVFRAAFSPDGQRLVTASDDHQAKLWETATGKLLATLPHPACVNSAVFSPDGDTILTGGNDGRVRLWATPPGGPVHQITPPLELDGQVFPAVFNQQGTLIAAASQKGVARVWDASTHAVLGTFEEHLDSINSLEFSRDGLIVVTSGKDRTARIWNPMTMEQTAVLQPHDSALRYAGFSPDGARLVTCAETGQSGLWHRDGTLVAWLEPRHQGLVRRAAFSPDGRLLVTAGGDGIAKVWQGETGRFLYSLNHADSADSATKLIYTVSFSQPDGRLLATAGQDGVVKIWDMQDNGRLVQTLTKHHGDEVIGVDFSPDRHWLSTAGRGGRAFAWALADTPTSPPKSIPLGGAEKTEAAGAALQRTIEGHSTFVALARFSADGGRMMSVDGPGRARVWSTEPGGGPLLETPPEIQVNDAVFDPAGNRLVTGDHAGTVAIWSLANGAAAPAPEKSFPALNGPVRSVLISADAKHFIVAGEERKKDPEGGWRQRSVVCFFNENGTPGAIVEGSNPALSPDGRLVVTLQGGNLAQVWTINGKPVATLTGHTARVVQATFSHDSSRIVTASEDRTAIVWDTAGHPLLPALAGRVQGGLFFVAFSPDDHLIAIISGGSPTQLWDAHSGQPRALLEGDQTYTASPTFHNIQPHASFSADGNLIVTQCFTNQVNVWDTQSGHLLARLKGHTGTVTAVAFSPVGSRLLTGSQDGTLRIWDTAPETASPEEVARLAVKKSP
ncbi:MAG: TIR domain-containing protein [Opitutaceae bacterium]|jgi:WD40 repeat protein